MATSIPLINSMRQSDLPTVPASFSAWLEINGTAYAIVKLAVRYSRTETKVVVDLASGNASRDIGGRPAIPPDFEFIKGIPARVMIEIDNDVRALWASSPDRSASRDLLLKKGTHVLMDGVIDDGGPSDLSRGRFNMRCVIVSKLIYLASGATHFSNVNVAHLNTLTLTGLTNNGHDMSVDTNLATNDFWAGVRSALSNIVLRQVGFQNTGVVRNFLAFAGPESERPPTQVVTALESIYGSLPSGGVFTESTMVDTVVSYLNAELYKDLGRQSILARLQALADDFFFALIEHGLGAGIVPYTPFVHSSECKNLWPSTIESVSWIRHDTVLVAGLVFIDNPYGSLTGGLKGPPDPTQFTLGGYKRPSVESAINAIDPVGNNLGLITTLPGPTWMKGSQVGIPGDTADDIQGKYGNIYARELALKQSYMGRVVSVKCPFRMDIGPCTPVRIVYPAIAGTGVAEETSMYGAVEAVTLVIDASAATAATELEVMYVRSKAQQELDVDQRPIRGDGLAGFGGQGSSSTSTKGFHPLWPQPYLGRRLDERPSDELTENVRGQQAQSVFGQS